MKLSKNWSTKLLSSFTFSKEVLLVLVFNLGVVALVFIIQNNLPPMIPLFYGKPHGSEQLASKTALAIPPVLTIVVAIINSVAIMILDNDFLQKVLLVTIYTLTFLSTITVFKIISLVSPIL